MAKERQINDQQKKFARRYLSHFNGRKAAIEADYEPSSAAERASLLLNKDNVKAYIKELLKEIKILDYLDLKKFVDELSKMAFIDINDFYGDDFSLKALNEISEDQRKAIHSIEVQKWEGGKEGRASSTTVKFKLYDKHKSIEMMLKILGMMNGERKDEGEVPVINEKIV